MNVQCKFVNVPGETETKFGFYRKPEDTAVFLKSFYEEAGVPPSVVEYVEGFGAGKVETSDLYCNFLNINS